MKAIRMLPLLAAFLVASCASMYEGMGIASKESLAASDAKIQALEGQVTDLTAKVGKLDDASQRVAEVEALLKKLQGRVDQLPQETLKKLADALTKAAAEAGSKP